VLSGFTKKRRMPKGKKRGTRRDWRKKAIVKSKELITMKFLLYLITLKVSYKKLKTCKPESLSYLKKSRIRLKV
jgi:hypothetical protein